MPTGKQVRAARVLANWDAPTLAKKAGLATETILKCERGQSEPYPDTMAKIIRAFAEIGIEFIGERGVAKQEDQILTLTGENVYLRILDDVIATLRSEPDAEALFACVEDGLSSTLVFENYRRLRKEGIAMRSLIQEGDENLHGNVDEYRYLPREHYINTPMVVYGDKVATMLYSSVATEKNEPNRSAIIISNASHAAALRNLFNFAWSAAEQPKQTQSTRRYDDEK